MGIYDYRTSCILLQLIVCGALCFDINGRTNILTVSGLLFGNGILQITIFIQNDDLTAADCPQLAFINTFQTALTDDTGCGIAFLLMLFQILSGDILHISGDMRCHFAIRIHASGGFLYKGTVNFSKPLNDFRTLRCRDRFDWYKHIILYPGG